MPWMNLSLPRKIAGMLPLLLLCACATPIAPPLPAFSCGSYIRKEWRMPVPGATMPDPVAADKTRWTVFGLEQTAQLDKANGQTGDVIATYDTCEAREAEVRKALAPRTLWQQLTPWREQ